MLVAGWLEMAKIIGCRLVRREYDVVGCLLVTLYESSLLASPRVDQGPRVQHPKWMM